MPKQQGKQCYTKRNTTKTGIAPSLNKSMEEKKDSKTAKILAKSGVRTNKLTDKSY